MMERERKHQGKHSNPQGSFDNSNSMIELTHQENMQIFGIQSKPQSRSNSQNNSQWLLDNDIPEHLRQDSDLKQSKSYTDINVQTTLSYVVGEMRKNSSSFNIGLLSVFLIVSFTALFTAFINITPALIFIIGQSNGGDIDVQISSLSYNDSYQQGNRNFYNDSPFSRKIEQSQINTTLSPNLFGQNISQLVNMTVLNSQLLSNPSVVGAYPRWIALAQVGSAMNKSMGDTGSFITFGDQKLERDLGIADGFPTQLIGSSEAIVSSEIMEIFDLEVGDEIEIKYEFLQFLPVRFDHLQDIVFNDDQQNHIGEEARKTQGQEFLEFFNINPNLTIGEIQQGVNQSSQSAVLINLITIVGMGSDTPISEVIEQVLAYFAQEDFIFRKNYTIKAEVNNLYGKWPKAYGNAIFLDSNYLLNNLYDMLASNIQQLQRRNSMNYLLIIQSQLLLSFVKQAVLGTKIEELAFQANVIFKDRIKKYTEDPEGSYILQDANDMYQDEVLYQTSKASLTIVDKIKTLSNMTTLLTNIMINIVMFLFIMSFILYYSLAKSDVEERQFEFAVLRTLGWQKKQMISFLSLKTLIFSVPGTIVGFIVMILMLNALTLLIFQLMNFKVYTEITCSLFGLAAFMGLVVPQISNILPAKQAMSNTLRDSLDIYRKKVDEIQVTIKKIEEIGVSVNQLIVGICLTVFGFYTYYFVPMSFILQNTNLFFFILFSVLLILVMGMIFFSQAFVPYCEKIVLYLIILVRPKDKKLYQIVKKNLRNHFNRNIKSSIMLTMTVAFLILVGTSFSQLEYMTVALTNAIIGADIALFQSNGDGQFSISLNQQQLSEFLDQNLASKGQGIVKTYGYLPAPMDEILRTEKQKVWIGFGMKNLNYFQVNVMGLQRDHLSVIGTEYYYPVSIWKPEVTPELNNGNEYRDDQVLEMMYDLHQDREQNFVQRDELGVISLGKNQNQMIDATIIDVLIPEAFSSVLPITVGSTAKLCIGGYYRGGGKRVQSENQCEMLFEARVVGTVKKMPGLFDMSGYQPAAFASPAVVVSQPQVQYMMERYTQQNKQARETYQSNLENQKGKVSYGIPKVRVFVKVTEDATSQEINKLKNNIIKVAEETNVFAFDMRKFNQDMRQNMIILYIASGLIATILFILTFFQVKIEIVTMYSCWCRFQAILETVNGKLGFSGILLSIIQTRAIGMSKSDINRLTLFEAVSTLLSSTILGFLIGVISAYACTSLFMMIVELPVVLMLPTTLIIMMVLMSAFVILMGSYVGNWQINKKTISQILKGSQ